MKSPVRLWLDIALHTGLRRGSMYRLDWPDVDFEYRLVREAKPKKRKTWHVPLNPVAGDAFLKFNPPTNSNGQVFNIKKLRPWLDKGITKAGITDFH